jgi:hypothetical protein
MDLYIVCDEMVWASEVFSSIKEGELEGGLGGFGKHWWFVEANSPDDASAIADIICEKENVHPFSKKLGNIEEWKKAQDEETWLMPDSRLVQLILEEKKGTFVFEATKVLTPRNRKLVEDQRKNRIENYGKNYFKFMDLTTT